MAESNLKPLITFAVCSYNQERYIREAVEAAFAQTYSPLEIVLSDDYSKDRTFEIMREMAAAYRGPHKVVLNRNPVNFGLGKHVNRLVELTRGELLVVAAGDDVSLPGRVAAVHDVWELCGRKGMAIQCGVVDMDDQGVLLGSAPVAATGAPAFSQQRPSLPDYVRTLRPGILGCALAYDPKLFAMFGPVPDQLIHEDNVIALRALLLGPLVFMRDPFLKRRIHGNNIYTRFHDVVTTPEAVARQEARSVRDAHNRVVMYDALLSDLRSALKQGLIQENEWSALETEALKRRRLFAFQKEYTTTNVLRKPVIMLAAWRGGADCALLKWMLPRLIPASVFKWLKVRGNSARVWLKTKFGRDAGKRWTFQGETAGSENSKS